MTSGMQHTYEVAHTFNLLWGSSTYRHFSDFIIWIWFRQDGKHHCITNRIIHRSYSLNTTWNVNFKWTNKHTNKRLHKQMHTHIYNLRWLAERCQPGKICFNIKGKTLSTSAYIHTMSDQTDHANWPVYSSLNAVQHQRVIAQSQAQPATGCTYTIK